jgi:hypothetical protein
VQSSTCDAVGWRVADLELRLDARGSGVHLATPACYAPFLVTGSLGAGLTLRVRDGALRDTEGWRSLFYDAETWQLWRDGAGCTVFVPSRYSPPRRQIYVDAEFRAGEVVAEFRKGLSAGQAVYPLQDIDMMLFANWLAESGDLIVHASGIDDHGAGYAFVGPAGAGKSTLVGELPLASGVTILGEDQVILRYQEGRFMVYGTPWHTNPARCSPGGGPLKKLFFLDRAADHGVEPCERMASIERLLQNAFVPYYNRAGVERILEALSCLAERVPFYTLGFQMGADVMRLVREA